jgi:prepilin peptidase CpaA
MNLSVSLAIFAAWAALVAVCDWRSRRISNSIVIAGFVLAIACTLLHRSPFHLSFGDALLGAAVGFVALLPFYAFRVMGAGDVKVFAVLGTWCGMHALFSVWMLGTLLAGLHAIVILLVTRTRIGELIRRRQPTFEVAGMRATPFVTCMVVPVLVIFGMHLLNGGVR